MNSKNLDTFTYNNADVFTEICRPIFNTSPITFCSFGRIFNDGTFTCFMSNPAWVDVYKKKHYVPTLSLWVEDKIKIANIGHAIWSLSDFYNTNTDTKNLLTDSNLFNYNNGISIVDRHPDYYEVATFASSQVEGIERFFIEKMDILRNSILHIKENIFNDRQLSNEIANQYKLPQSIISDGVNDFLDPPALKLNKYYIGHPLKDNAYLTQREVDCLVPFLAGVPMKVISLRLNISIRTVETHLDKIKSKCVMPELSNLRLVFANNQYISAMIPKILTMYLG